MLIKDNPVKNCPDASKKQRIPFLDGPDLQTGITRIWLVRHALVAPVFRQIMYGNADVSLCLETIKEQRHIYESLSRRLPRPACWITSPVKRAVVTAQTLLKAGKLSVGLKEDSRFVEQDLGGWTGLHYDEFCLRRKQEASDFWALSAAERPPHGESLEDVLNRVGTALEVLAQQNAGQETIIVSHGGVIRMALAYVMGIPAQAALCFTVQNLSTTVIEYIAGQWRVITVNSLSHFQESYL